MQTRTDEIQKLLRQARIYNYLNKPWHYIHLRLLNNNSAAPLWSECCMLMMRLKRSHVFVKCSKMEQPFHVQSCWHWWDENFIEDIPIKLQLFMKYWRPSGVCNSSSRRLNQQIILAYRTLYWARTSRQGFYAYLSSSVGQIYTQYVSNTPDRCCWQNPNQNFSRINSKAFLYFNHTHLSIFS